MNPWLVASDNTFDRGEMNRDKCVCYVQDLAHRNRISHNITVNGGLHSLRKSRKVIWLSNLKTASQAALAS